MNAVVWQIHSELCLELENPGSLSVACFLLCHGASLDAKNHRHVSPIMHIVDHHVIDVVRRYVRFFLCLCLLD